MYSTMEIHYNTNKKIEKCYLSNFYNKKSFKTVYNMMRYYKSKKKIQHQISNKKNNVMLL